MFPTDYPPYVPILPTIDQSIFFITRFSSPIYVPRKHKYKTYGAQRRQAKQRKKAK